jgi:hypothetical protein
LIACLAVLPALAGCIAKHSEGLSDYWAPPPTDEGSSFDAKTRYYVSPDAKIEVKMPGTPVHDRHFEVRTTNAKKRVRYETPSATYVIATANVPTDEVWTDQMQPKLATSEVLLMKSDINASTESNSYPVAGDGSSYTGKHAEGMTRDGKYYRVRSYLDKTNKRVYRLMVVGTKESVLSEECNEFFNTFKITK